MEESWYFLEAEAKGRFIRALTESEHRRLLRSLNGHGEVKGLGALWSQLVAWFDRAKDGISADLNADRSTPQEQCC